MYIDCYDAGFTYLKIECDSNSLIKMTFVDKSNSTVGSLGADGNFPVLQNVRKWLDTYFSGAIPDFTPDIRLLGTDFQMRVWQKLLKIPYGKTVTYGEIAREIAKENGKTKMSAQAVGGAVGKNPIGIIVPCHRVIGKNGSLTGFAGGIEVKRKLLEIEAGSVGKVKR